MIGAEVSLNDVTEELVGIFRDPGILLGIPLALAGAVFMSFGAQYQHRGVMKVEHATGESGAGLSGRQLLALAGRPSWVLGTLMLGLAIICQLGALSVAPLILVQPIGAIALVITTLLNAHVSGHKPTRRSLFAIVLCLAGIFAFVTIAAFFATEHEITPRELWIILAILAVVLVIFCGIWLWRRRQLRALFYISAGGVVYGFVATLAKVVISRIQSDDFDWLTVLCIVGLLVAAGVGSYFVQTSYSVGPPDLVIAGLTVIDPIVAVVIGLVVLGEASTAPGWALVGFAAAGAVAIVGVFLLTRYHPQVISDSQDLHIPRGSHGTTPSV
ncbi:DMT family transporter [Microbacterium sp. P07]|uniref:DMT family transporter n=1 Tax=Microbacterium sp. P07 TaxID=3366952 RepID=UPI0037473F07